jgi:hypothetical protein
MLTYIFNHRVRNRLLLSQCLEKEIVLWLASVCQLQCFVIPSKFLKLQYLLAVYIIPLSRDSILFHVASKDVTPHPPFWILTVVASVILLILNILAEVMLLAWSQDQADAIYFVLSCAAHPVPYTLVSTLTLFRGCTHLSNRQSHVGVSAILSSPFAVLARVPLNSFITYVM